MCDCAHWFDFTTTDQDLFDEENTDEVTVDCSKTFAFDGRGSSNIKKLIFPDGCDNDSFVQLSTWPPQLLVIEGELAREVLVDVTNFSSSSAVVIEHLNPLDDSSPPL